MSKRTLILVSLLAVMWLPMACVIVVDGDGDMDAGWASTWSEEHDDQVDANKSLAREVSRRLASDPLLDDIDIEVAAKQGLIFVDTKYEIGRLNGELVVSDEVNTPDSSRYWYRDRYQRALSEGRTPEALDKEYVRRWLAEENDYLGDGDPPALTGEVCCETARRYIEAYERITGTDFVPNLEPAEARIRRNLGL